MTNKQLIGKQGEEMAINYYKKNHYTILDTNWRYGQLEIDIIAKNETQIIFCEVKTRANSIYGQPQEFVNKQKQNNVIRAANNYMNRKNISLEARFDIIAIVTKGDKCHLEHLPDAFTPKW